MHIIIIYIESPKDIRRVRVQ